MTIVILACPESALATNSGPFTAELWVKPTSSIASQALVGKSEEIRIFTDASGYVGCQIKATSWQTAATATTNALSLNTWAHVACTYDKANIKVYVNGSQVATTTQTSAPDDTANTFKIGQDDSASTPYSNLTGVVDGFEFYNYALTSKQIVSDMNASSGVIANAVKQSSPVGYWKFDEGQGTVANNSGNGGSAHNGIITNAAWSQAGKYGKALNFDGNGDYLTVPSSSNWSFGSNDFTIDFWINPDTSQTGPLMGRRWTNRSWMLYLQSGVLYWIASSDGTNWTAPFNTSTALALTLTNNTWQHVVFERSGSNWYAYLNGIQKSTNTSSMTLYSSSEPLHMGGDDDGGVWYYSKSLLDEVKIYNYALTADEVKLDYNRGSSLILGAAGTNSTYQPNAANQEYCVPGDSSTCTAPVGRWDFEDTSQGSSVQDSSGNNNTGTWNGTGSHWTTGKNGKAGNFNGSNDYVDIGNNLNQTTNDFTLSAWVRTKFSPANSVALIIEKENSSPGFQVGMRTSGTAYAFIRDAGATLGTTDDGPAINDGKWHHIAAVFDRDGNLTRYVDGRIAGTQDSISARSGTLSNSESLLIGEYSGVKSTYNWNGSIDGVRIYNYARSAAQIAYDYNRGGPVGWWKMDECQGATAHDSSGNGNNGTITIGTGAGTGHIDAVGTCTTSGTAWYNGSTGKRNASMSFDGIDDKVTIGTAITGVQSIAFWVKPATNTDSYVDLDGGTHYITSSTGTVSATGFSSPTIYVNGVSGGTITGGAWNHVVITTATSFNSTTNFTLGYKSAATADYLNGQIDDVRVYNYALTAAQVKDVMNQGAVFFGPVTGSP